MRRGEPSRTAFGAAVHRAVHQDLEGGRVFRDDLAWPILGDVDRARLVAEARQRSPALRLFIAVRHRFAEDTVAAAHARGVRQVVVLGAGLDTFAYRHRHPDLHVLEVDHPDTAAWKQERIRRADIEPSPGGVGYVGVDFERDDLLSRLSDGGLATDRPATFLWLGVVPYLSQDAVAATLGRLGDLPGAEVVLDYPAPTDDPSTQALRDDLARRTAAAGEPMRSSFEPASMEKMLRDAGFTDVEDLGRAEILPRFFGVPEPQVSQPGGGGAHVVRARRSGG